MKRAFTLILSTIISSFVSQSIAQQTGKVTPDGIGYYEYLPDGYHSDNDRYPVVIFLHGYKEKGTSSTDPKLVLRDLPRAAYVALPKYVKQGKKYPFILITPQLKSQYASWPPSYVMQVLNHVKKTLRIDERRIYLTGLSLGGFGVWKTAGEYPGVFAAIGPLCAGANALNKAQAIAKEDIAVWAFHGGSDRVVSHGVTTSMVNAINSAPNKPNPLAKVTIFPGMGHDIWDKAYQQTDLLKWMLTFRNGSRGTSPTPPSNKPPVANAGQSKTITLPTNSVNLRGTASDSDGDVVDYKWTKISGGQATLANTHQSELRVSDLQEGTYVFRLTIKDNDGDSDSDDATVTVKKDGNKPPIVKAGTDRRLSLPENRISLEGSADDPDGGIKSYAWSKRSGGKASMSGTSTETLHLSDLEAGTYVFRLTATDNDGKSGSDDVAVVVAAQENRNEEDDEDKKEEEKVNQSPVVGVGRDRSIKMPTNRVVIQATADDPDGEIQSYQWIKISGGSVSLSGDRSPLLTVSGLREGYYVFRVVVSDDKGAKATDDIRITVQPEDKKQENVTETGSGKNQNQKDGEVRPPSPSPKDIANLDDGPPERTARVQKKNKKSRAGMKWLNY